MSPEMEEFKNPIIKWGAELLVWGIHLAIVLVIYALFVNE